MVFFADLALKITWANRATSQLTGLSIEEMVGRFCYEVLRQKNAPCEGCPAVASLSTGRIEKNDSISCFGKNRRITAYPVPDLSGNITGMAVSIGGIRVKDISLILPRAFHSSTTISRRTAAPRSSWRRWTRTISIPSPFPLMFRRIPSSSPSGGMNTPGNTCSKGWQGPSRRLPVLSTLPRV